MPGLVSLVYHNGGPIVLVCCHCRVCDLLPFYACVLYYTEGFFRSERVRVRVRVCVCV